ncbi:MAG: flagellar basal body rod protein FlgB [Sphingomonas sp.]|uniref:Flagellar basal body rod protein FlgB n=1 Tax=Variovorax paradoxus TaxID=34073 RepID=A0A2W5QCB8_VARPD|nr:MAG: flagellar basal body rod protein FlgB [Variovorax paradoxus]PZU73147.1 MAG: flagellar basal body rod protein FlgB [Sphingomonas sp.]
MTGTLQIECVRNNGVSAGDALSIISKLIQLCSEAVVGSLGLSVSSDSHLKSDSGDNFAATALEFRARRQALIASNIANADVPNYQAREISFADRLSAASNSATPLKLSSTNAGHLADRSAPTRTTVDFAEYTTAGQPSADNNTVDMNSERAKSAQNSILYEFATQIA